MIEIKGLSKKEMETTIGGSLIKMMSMGIGVGNKIISNHYKYVAPVTTTFNKIIQKTKSVEKKVTKVPGFPGFGFDYRILEAEKNAKENVEKELRAHKSVIDSLNRQIKKQENIVYEMMLEKEGKQINPVDMMLRDYRKSMGNLNAMARSRDNLYHDILRKKAYK